MADARAAEYRAVIEAACEAIRAGSGTAGSVRRLRAELRRIGRRDFFPPPERERAHAAVRTLADEFTPPGATAARAGRPEKEQA
ncbi:hypothetical protein [Streptomyces marispadix]|uniref:Uncharacterized protein n=1 Tax=Streptomyces marispadix TaxID=2922868 RepID=A0ABS9SUI7_9ACTN|nr:hypothetical protein [Streptomyces marispadix]MCH6159946.1 hypothetical protein [Streptomyces marispadix]